jgi:phage/plasmid primase-like uncharacterized protein
MADLSNIFGGPWALPTPKHIDTPEGQLRSAMLERGITPPPDIHIDGKLHRFRSGTKGEAGHDKSGWYVIYGDGIPSGQYGDWRTGEAINFRADIGRELSTTELMINATRQAEAKALRDADQKRAREVAENTVDLIWTKAAGANDEHPYLKRKGIGVNGARITGDGRLVVPLYGQDGTLSSLQYIDHEGGKLYHSGGATGGKFWMLGTMDDPGTLYVGEGFATCATIHEASNRPCAVAYSASNIVVVTGILREIYGAAQDIVIVADNDASGVGQRYSEQASAKYGARMVMPPMLGDANDYAQAGHDLAALLAPVADDWLIPADDFCSKPAPIKWLVKNWLQADALCMVHGPSGGGKTFVMLDWCLRMASGMTDWIGHKVKPCNVVYLAGEGHHGLRGRIAAWKHHHQAGKLSMWLSKAGCDLNTSAGYLKIVDSVRALKVRPEVIVVDTLHRFLLGDENSSQDAKTMLDACAALMQEFGCTVVLVHHTGVSDEAQHRARGSSAWRGALDIEISIVPGKEGKPMEIVQRKSKDAEMASDVFVKLEQVEIPGWMDEDDQPVTSAVIVQAEKDNTEPKKKDGKIDTHRKTWENAWAASGMDELDGYPYLTRSALRDKLEADGNAERTVRNMLNPSYSDKLIGYLLNSEVIEATQNGWIMRDEVHASVLLMRKNACG